MSILKQIVEISTFFKILIVYITISSGKHAIPYQS